MQLAWLPFASLLLISSCAADVHRWQELDRQMLTVQAGDEVVLDATSFGLSGSYRWKQLTGPMITISEPTSAMLRFVAPEVNDETLLVLSLSIVNGHASSTAAFMVKILPGEMSNPGRVLVYRGGIAPVIDGDLAEFADASTLELVVSATRVTGTYALSWDDDNLYVGVDVSDPDVETSGVARDDEVWNDDSIELMFDPGNEGGEQLSPGDFKITINADGLRRDSEGTASGTLDISWNPEYEVAAISTATGYRIEVAIPWTAFGLAAAPTSAWGFDAALNDTLSSGATNKAVWWNENGGTVNDPAGWGELDLVE